MRSGSGLRSRAGAVRPGLLAVVITTCLALATVIAVGGLAARSDVAPAEPVSYDNAPTGVLTHDDGTPITNIHPYSSSGEPLTGVLHYDQDVRSTIWLTGRPTAATCSRYPMRHPSRTMPIRSPARW